MESVSDGVSASSSEEEARGAWLTAVGELAVAQLAEREAADALANARQFEAGGFMGLCFFALWVWGFWFGDVFGVLVGVGFGVC